LQTQRPLASPSDRRAAAPLHDPGGKRARTKLQNREAILTAARDVFAELGYEASSVRDIIGRTGLASGTFYNYYRSKEEIAAAVAADAATRLRPLLRAERDAARDFASYLDGIVRAYFRFLVDEQTALKTTRPLAEQRPRVRAQTPAHVAVADEVRSAIADVVDRGLGPRIDVDYLTAAVIGVAREIGERMLARRPLNVDAAATFAVNLILRGLPLPPRAELPSPQPSPRERGEGGTREAGG
jgi:AcrR family transcriptional regulator